MANYFEIANDVLSELGLAQKTSFSQFQTRTELEILRHISDLNYITTLDVKFEYRIRSTTLVVPTGVTSIANPLATIGEIRIEQGGIIDIPHKTSYVYNSQCQDFLLYCSASNSYGIEGTTLLFMPWEVDRTLTIYYYTWCSAKNSLGVDIPVLVNATDTPLMPVNLQSYILVDGTCLELKKRTDNSRLPHWKEHLDFGKNQLRAYTQNQDSQARFQINQKDSCFIHNVRNNNTFGY